MPSLNYFVPHRSDVIETYVSTNTLHISQGHTEMYRTRVSACKGGEGGGHAEIEFGHAEIKACKHDTICLFYGRHSSTQLSST